jgi:enolase
MKLTKIHAREILDSRGNPTVEVEMTINGVTARGISPSGASTGQKEAVELRDGDPKRYSGKGVEKAVNGINVDVKKSIVGLTFNNQDDFDKHLIALDGTENKSRLGANAMLAASIAFARTSSVANNIPLYRHLWTRKIM